MRSCSERPGTDAESTCRRLNVLWACRLNGATVHERSSPRPERPMAKKATATRSRASGADGDAPERDRLKNKAYLAELSRLQVELVKLQEWIKHEGLKVVVVFEGRDAAGKGGVIK